MKERQINFEILRVILMYMIVVGHAMMHGLRHIASTEIPDLGIDWNNNVDAANFIGAQFLGYANNVAVNAFVLLSGYFMTKPRGVVVTLRKTLRLWVQVVLFALFTYAVSIAVGHSDFSWGTVFVVLTPISHNLYWFMTMYMVLLLLSPLTSRLMSRLSQKQYTMLVIMLLIVTFEHDGKGLGHYVNGSLSIPFYMTMFLLGGYIKRFEPLKRFYKYGLAFYVVACVALTLLSVRMQLSHLGEPGHEFLYLKGLANMDVTIFTSLAFFVWFVQRQFTGSAFTFMARYIAPLTLGVYLVHDNRLIRDVVWRDMPDFFHEPWLLAYALGYSLLIYCCGIVMAKVVGMGR